MSRRRFLQLSTSRLGAAIVGTRGLSNLPLLMPVGSDTLAASTHQPLWIPPTITGPNFDLTLAPHSKQFFPGTATATYGFNDSEFWGPTLIMNKDDQVLINVTNKLSEETTSHWHGFHLPAQMDGGPMQPIAAGTTWSPTFKVMNNAGTFWYHPHLHQKTMEQLNYGAGGFIIVRDSAEAALALPRTYGIDDIPLVLTSRSFSGSNAISLTTIYGDHMLTNGTLNAEVSLPAQFVRFRLLNCEIERAYNLGFSDNRTFYVIATDGGLVNAPVPVKRLLMVPGERYEILVDLSKQTVGSSLTLQSFNGGQPFGFPGGEPAQSGAFGSLLNNTTFDVLHINVIQPTAKAIMALPAKLASNTYWTASDVTNKRALSITDKGPGTPFTFNNMSYDMMMIDQTVALNATEQWTITNGRTFGHAFHIHDVQFKIISRSTGPVPASQQGWKDTFYIQIDEAVSFVAKFTDFASKQYAYMYHCHMADHEDGGLMGQFLVE
jgi:bilirubin oxidase